MLVTVLGAVREPGVREVAIGTPVGQLLDLAGGASAPLQALLFGGYFGAWVDAAGASARPFSSAGLADLGAGPGAGLIAALPAGACGLGETARVVRYLAADPLGSAARAYSACPRSPARSSGSRKAGRRPRAAAPVARPGRRPRRLRPPGRCRPAGAQRPADVRRCSPGGVLPCRRAAAVTAPARLRVDFIACDGRGLCAEALPELITLDDWGFPIVTARPVPRPAAGDARATVRAFPSSRSGSTRG